MRGIRFELWLATTAIALVAAGLSLPVQSAPLTEDEISAAVPMPEPANLPPPPKPQSMSVQVAEPPKVPLSHPLRSSAFALSGALLLGLLGSVAPKEFISHLTIFVLACFVGWQVVWNVTPALHTPLMSVTNAISGIILVGGMLQISGPLSSPVTLLSAAAVLLATINVSGGFWVTTRMLRMFQR